MFLRTTRRQFWQPCKKNIDRSQMCSAINRKNFRSISEHDESTTVFCSKEIVFPKVCQWTRQKQFRQSCWKILPDGRKCSPLVWKWKESKNIFKNCIFLLRAFQWTRRMQFWQSGWENFAERPKIFPLSSKVTKKC